MLDVISSGSFNLATLDKVEPCKPPIRRQPTETTRQFIERAMNFGLGLAAEVHVPTEVAMPVDLLAHGNALLTSWALAWVHGTEAATAVDLGLVARSLRLR